MQKRNVLNSARLLKFKKQRRKVAFKKFSWYLLLFLAVFALVVYLSHLKRLNISDIEITGNKIVNTDAIKATVQEQIGGKYLGLFPKTNILFYPENSIKNALQNKFARLEDINLSIKNDKTLAISLTERTAKYTWCGNAPTVGVPQSGGTSDVGCYFMDENGYIFDEAPYFSGEVYFKFYGETSAATPLGSYYSKQNFQQLLSFKDGLVTFGLKPVALYITYDGEIKFILSGGTATTLGPEIILNNDSDFQKVAENLETALTTEPLQTEFKNKYSALQYIDLRFGNKVYYKFQ